MFFQLGKKKETKQKNGARHIALAMNGIEDFAEDKKIEKDEAWSKAFSRIREIMQLQVEKDTPIMTFNLLPVSARDNSEFVDVADSVAGFFDEMRNWDFIHKNKIKISIIGKWYDLPAELVESVKKISRETRDYDSFFVNFCINYGGRAEIVDAFRVIAMKIKNGSLDPDSITQQDIKENIYSSYLVPPDLMVVTGKSQATGGFLLWDSVNTKIYFTDRLWPDFKKDDLSNILGRMYK